MLGAFGGSSIATVTLAGIEAEVIEGNSSDRVVIEAAAGSGAGDVVITADTGAETVQEGAWVYLTQGLVTTVSPAFGQDGTTVTIRGEGMLGGGDRIAKVYLGMREATIIQQNNTVIVVTAPGSDNYSSVVPEPVRIIADTGARITRNSSWTYRATGTVSSVEPAFGQLNTAVTVSGSSLRGHGDRVDSVTLAGVSARILSQTDSEVVVVAGEGSSGDGAVELTANTGAVVSLAGGWSYRTAGRIASITPDNGQTGTRVTIEGSNLRGHGDSVTNVSLAGVAAEIVMQNDTVTVASAGQGPTDPETGDVILISSTGATVTQESGFSYLRPGQIQDVSPVSGVAGARVTIFGSRLCGGGQQVARVTLLGLEAQVLAGGTCNRVTVVAADFGASATGDVIIESDTGAVITGTDRFTYIADGNITQVTPSAGQDGTIVLIEGNRLLGGGTRAASVTFDGVAGFVHHSNDSAVAARVFGGPPDGSRGDIVVTSDTGVSVRRVNGWTYSGISSISPNSGQRGTVVTIRGTALLASGTDVDTIRLSEVLVSSVLSASDTEIVVVAGPEIVEREIPGAVTITANNGQVVSRSDAFTYLLPGQINAVLPSSGQQQTRVTIRGTNLFNYGTEIVNVTLAGTAATIEYGNNTEIVVIAEPSSAVQGDVVINTDTGGQVVLVDGWQYVAVASISSVSPGIGQYNTVVTIEGSDLFWWRDSRGASNTFWSRS